MGRPGSRSYLEGRCWTMPDTAEPIRALATVTLDAGALDVLAPTTIDRLVDLVEAKLVERRAAGEERLLSAIAAAELADVSPDTIRRAVRTGALVAVGYVGGRPRLRRSEVEAWIARGQRPAPLSSEAGLARPGFRPRPRRRVLGDALEQFGGCSMSVLQRAVEGGRLGRNPVRLVRKIARPRREVKPLAPVTVEAMRAASGPRDATLLSVLAYSGLRPLEALALQWGDVRLRTL